MKLTKSTETFGFKYFLRYTKILLNTLNHFITLLLVMLEDFTLLFHTVLHLHAFHHNCMIGLDQGSVVSGEISFQV